MVLQGQYTYLSKKLRGVVLSWLLVLAVASSQQVWAWGNTGHEAVAYIAWQQMNSDTQKRVMQLLMLVPTLHNPENTKSIPGYSDWVTDLPAGLSQDQQNLYLFMRAATWPTPLSTNG